MRLFTHVRVAQWIEQPLNAGLGRGFESRQRGAYLEAPGLVTWGFFVLAVDLLT